MHQNLCWTIIKKKDCNYFVSLVKGIKYFLEIVGHDFIIRCISLEKCLSFLESRGRPKKQEGVPKYLNPKLYVNFFSNQ